MSAVYKKSRPGYYRPLSVFALKYTGDLETAKEIVQELFVHLFLAVGYQGQWITIIPELELVVVFNNKLLEGDNFQWSTPERLLTT